jgi:hypothetical protein
LFRSTIRNGKYPKQFSTHSFRGGGASLAFSSEIASELIQLYGEWKSDADKKYLRFNFKDNIDISRRMVEHINTKFKS